MAQESGFFNAQLAGEEYDRVYLAEHFANYFASFIGNGIFGHIMRQLEVSAQANPNMSVKVLPGQAWINGYWYRNSDNFTLNFAVADGVLSRIDMVVLRWDNSGRSMYLHVLQGIPSANPVPPTFSRSSDYYDLGLAYVSIPGGSIKITQAQITDLRLNNNFCGLVTGLVDQVDTTDLWNQFEQYFLEFKQNQEAGFNTWKTAQETAFVNWVSTTQAAYDSYIADTQADYDTWTQDKKDAYDAWVAQKQSDYDSWVSVQVANFTQYVQQQEQLYSDFVTQKQSDYNQWVAAAEAAHTQWVADQQAAYNAYIAGLKDDYDTYTAGKKTEWETWVDDQQTAFMQFVTTETTAYNTWISQREQAFSLWYSNHTQQWEQDFNTWFDGIKGQLAGDIATSLQNQINTLAEKQPTVEIATIEHDKNRYLNAHLFETTYACGVQGAGEGPAGGGALVSTPMEYTMDDKNHITFKAKSGFGTFEQTVKLSDDMYTALFVQKLTSLVLILS